MDKLIHVGLDGKVKVTTIAAKFWDGKIKAGLSEEEIYEEIKGQLASKQGAKKEDIELVSESAIPADRTFRNAWKKKAGGVDVDMTKAAEIAKERIRQARKPRLEALDVEYQRADELQDLTKKQKIAQQKQILRDATARTELTYALTPDELKAAMQTVIEDIKI